MRINHNIAALNTYRQLTTNSANGQKSIEKLSSGLRINRAGDDAAGLAISEKMRGQIRGLDQASRNAQDSISLIQTAEGALNETHSILQRMRELSVQASNDTNSADDRAEIQKEVDQLTSEIDRIGNTTEFNTKKLLNGGAGIQATQTEGTGVQVVSGGAGVKAGGDLVMNTIAAAESAEVVIDGNAALTIGTAGADLKINGVTVSLAAGTVGADVAEAINNVTGQTGVTATYDATAFTLTLASQGVGSAQKIEISGLDQTVTTAAADDTFGVAEFSVTANGVATKAEAAVILASTNTETLGVDATMADTTGTTGTAPTSFSSKGNEITFHGGDYDGLVINVENADAESTLHIDANNSLTLQIGANEGQEMNVSVQDMRAVALGVDAIDVTTQANAKAAISTIDDAVKSVSAERSKLGAVQNRLEHTINNLGTSSENLTAAESRVRDVDMAKEMMEFTKNNILNQAATAMLAQANQQPQGVLQLLR